MEQHNMFARVLSQGDQSNLRRTLQLYGHPQPETLLPPDQDQLALELVGVPPAAAPHIQAWLNQPTFAGWWYDVGDPTSSYKRLLIGGKRGQLARFLALPPHPASVEPILALLLETIDALDKRPMHLLLGDTHFDLNRRTYVMGILNVTTDSFSDGGLYLSPQLAVKHAEKMLQEGADLIDVGGQSSRPGATPIPAAVERDRVVPVVRDIVKQFSAHVSVDTYRASVAEACLDVGAVLINDISAMRFDPNMAPLIARHHASVVLMHMQGTPKTMQLAPHYDHVVDDVYGFLHDRLQQAMRYGMGREQIVLDPGFGFGKTVKHNLELLKGLAAFQALGQPILVGTSRKSFLGHLLQREVWDRLEGTLTSVIYAISQGAALVRVHDVASVVQAVRVANALAKPSDAFLSTTTF
jgi:dihydropteroate synthase